MSDHRSIAESLAGSSELHEILVRRARATDPGRPGEVLNLVAAVVIHGLVERAAVLDRTRLVSAELRRGLEEEHASLRDALELIEELAADADADDDLRALCRAVHEKVVRHVERDERVIYGSLARLGAFSSEETG
jgi:hypothetical protein